MAGDRTCAFGLKLHESMIVIDSCEGRWQIMRVTGGWIYTEYTAEVGFLFRSGGTISSSTFVPDPGEQ